MFKSTLVALALLSFAHLAQAAEPEKVSGARWGTRIVEVKPDHVVVKLMLVTGQCVPSVPGMKYGTAGDLVNVATITSSSFVVGQDADLWVGNTEATFQIPACVTTDW